MKRVLLTGAGGFVGSHVLRHFLEDTDWHIVVTDSFRRVGSLDRIAEQIKGEEPRFRLKVVPADLSVPFSPQLVHKLGDIDYIVNVASDSHVDRSITDPRECVENNVQLMLSLLEYAREHPVEKFLQVSTDEVYGPAPDGHRHAEGEPHRPSNPYSASKACQEDIAFSYWRTFDIPLILTNTMNIIGEMQHPEKFVPGVLSKVLRGETVQIHCDADGRIGSRMYLHARNQADALLFLLRNHRPNAYGFDIIDPSRFNVVGEREVDNLEMAQQIAAFAGEELKYELIDFHSSRPGHDLRYALDGSRMKSVGWAPPVPLWESLRRTVSWTVDHPEWLLAGDLVAA